MSVSLLIDPNTRKILGHGVSNDPQLANFYVLVDEVEDVKLRSIPAGRQIETATVDANGIVTVTLAPTPTHRDATLGEMASAWAAAVTTATASIQALPASATKTALANVGTALQRLADRDAALAQAVNQIDNVKLELLAELVRTKTIRQVLV